MKPMLGTLDAAAAVAVRKVRGVEAAGRVDVHMLRHRLFFTGALLSVLPLRRRHPSLEGVLRAHPADAQSRFEIDMGAA